MEGSGKMLVIAVGEHSQVGLIAKLLRSSSKSDKIPDENENLEKGRSILQGKLTKLAIQIGYIGKNLSMFFYFPIQFFQHVFKRNDSGDSHGDRFDHSILLGRICYST